jgi:hypothetical protein
MRDRPVTGILSLRQHTATYLSDVASLTKEVVSLINGGGFFAVLFALRRLRSRRHLWLNLTMLLFLGASFILYYLSTSAGSADDQQGAVTWYMVGTPQSTYLPRARHLRNHTQPKVTAGSRPHASHLTIA